MPTVVTTDRAISLNDVSGTFEWSGPDVFLSGATFTVTADFDDGSIATGDAVSITDSTGGGFFSDFANSFYLGTYTLPAGHNQPGTEVFVFGPDAVPANNSKALVLEDPDLENQFTSAISFTASEIDQSGAVFCFAAGTQIITPLGECAVETLKIGDPIMTADGRTVPVKWLGVQTVCSLFAGPKMEPVRIRAGALGNGLPHSDLTVTADHGLLVDGLVINAGALVNGATIDWVPLSELPGRVTYYHVETENHDVILANGAPAETFIDYAGRQAFDNYREYLDLYGAERIIREMTRPRISAQRLVPERIRRRLGIPDEAIPLDLLTG